MDILDLIREEHRQIENLLSELERTDNTYNLYQCFNHLYEALNLLAQVEGQTFYPAIWDGQNKDLVDTAQKEHEEAQQILEELESLSPTSKEFKQKFGKLKQVIQQHIQEEESKVFSHAKDCMNKEEREQLGSKFKAVKSQLESEISVAS